MGATGPAGATGATGPAFAPARGYFQFEHDAPITLNGGDNISFTEMSAVLNMTLSAPDAVLIQCTGVYRVAYGMFHSSSSASGSLVVLRVNGSTLGIGQLNSSIALSGMTVSGDLIIPLAAGDLLQLGIDGFATTLTSLGIGAYLSVVQVA